MSTTGQTPRGPQREIRPIETPNGTTPNGVTPNGIVPNDGTGSYTIAPSRRKNNPYLVYGIVAAVIVILGFVFMRKRAASGGGGDSTAAAGGGGGGKGGKGGGDNAKTVNYTTAEMGSLTQLLTVTGTLRANQNVGLSSRVAGRVARVTVNEGDRVKRGQLLIALEDDDLRALLAQATANLRAAQVRSQQTVLGIPARVAQVNTAIVTAQSQLQSAQARYRQAVLKAPVTSATARSGVRQARETVSQAQQRVNQARETARQTDLTTQAQVRASEAAVRAAQANLADVKRGSREQQIASSQQQVKIIEAQLANADTELTRQQTLVTGGAAPQSALDTARTQRAVIAAQLEAARQNLSLVQEGNTNEQIQQADQQVRQSQAQLAQSQAGRAAVINAQSDITSALAQLTSARAAQSSAEANLLTIPQATEDVRAAKEAVDQAKSAVQQAIANRSQIPVAQADVPAAQAAVRQAAAQVEQAQVNLNNARLFSPVDGIVTAKNTDVGEGVTTGSSLLDIVALDSVYFEAQISQADLSRVQVGQPVQVSVPTVSTKPLPGSVTEIIPVADARLRLFRLRITIANAPRLTPGAFASGVITTQVTNNSIVVPTGAVQTDENDKTVAYVAVKKGGKMVAAVRTVKLGGSQGEKVEVLSGLQSGDNVILNQGNIGEGDEVKLASQPGLPGQTDDTQSDAQSAPEGIGSTGGGGMGSAGSSGTGATGVGTSGTASTGSSGGLGGPGAAASSSSSSGTSGVAGGGAGAAAGG